MCSSADHVSSVILAYWFVYHNSCYTTFTTTTGHLDSRSATSLVARLKDSPSHSCGHCLFCAARPALPEEVTSAIPSFSANIQGRATKKDKDTAVFFASSTEPLVLTNQVTSVHKDKPVVQQPLNFPLLANLLKSNFTQASKQQENTAPRWAIVTHSIHAKINTALMSSALLPEHKNSYILTHAAAVHLQLLSPACQILKFRHQFQGEKALKKLARKPKYFLKKVKYLRLLLHQQCHFARSYHLSQSKTFMHFFRYL